MDILISIEKKINDALGLLDQLEIHGQKNWWIGLNSMEILKNALKEIEDEKEIQKLNSEVPKNKEQKINGI